MRKFIIFLLFSAFITLTYAQSYTRSNNNFTQITTTTSDIKTEYTYTVKGVVYPIYITKNGRCYIIRTSKNGKDYKQYLEEDIARQICNELGITYKESK